MNMKTKIMMTILMMTNMITPAPPSTEVNIITQSVNALQYKHVGIIIPLHAASSMTTRTNCC